jgi:hypothetical protein
VNAALNVQSTFYGRAFAGELPVSIYGPNRTPDSILARLADWNVREDDQRDISRRSVR